MSNKEKPVHRLALVPAAERPETQSEILRAPHESTQKFLNRNSAQIQAELDAARGKTNIVWIQKGAPRGETDYFSSTLASHFSERSDEVQDRQIADLSEWLGQVYSEKDRALLHVVRLMSGSGLFVEWRPVGDDMVSSADE